MCTGGLPTGSSWVQEGNQLTEMLWGNRLNFLVRVGFSLMMIFHRTVGETAESVVVGRGKDGASSEYVACLPFSRSPRVPEKKLPVERQL